MRKLLNIILILLYPLVPLFAQGDVDEQQRIFYRNERTVALSLYSNGFGFSYREGKRLNFLNKRLFEVDLSIVKHPKEIKLSNPNVQTGGNFIFGKLNSTYFLRGGLGHQHEIFKKMDLGGVAIRYFFIGGPEISISKPIYYNVLYPVGGNSFELRKEKFDETLHDPQDIYSKASFFKGLNEIGIVPGLHGRGGFNFEYSKEDKVIHAIEIGAAVDAFPKKIPIMAADDNKALFLTLFVSYRIGFVVDPLDPESTKIPTLFFRK
ncbi:MAG TPA: hypothetical protein VMW76_10485 [Bacteroidales bacterium]|nr:hypothetical protein [Bacteroidales bacterium]